MNKKKRSPSMTYKASLVIFVMVLLLPLCAMGGPSRDHALWDKLLLQYNHMGKVDYAGFKQDVALLDAYLEELTCIDPQSLGRDEQFAFYINAYNAWTVKLILTAYPDIESIKDLGSLFKSPWKKKFVEIDGKTVTLDHIEHDILRPRFKDPRVHFAINCAAKSCPPLYRQAFVGMHLNAQLDDATRQFINDPRDNRLEGQTLYVSSIFKWFKADFEGDIVGFFERYASPELKASIKADRNNLRVKYLDYDWSLNGE